MVYKQEEVFAKREMNNEASKEPDNVRADAFFDCSEAMQNAVFLNEIPEETKEIFSELYRKFCEQEVFDSDGDGIAAERALGDYFSAMVDFLEKAEKERSRFQGESKGYASAVEGLYLMFCSRDRRSNSYYIPEQHPIRVLNRRLDKIFDDLLEKNVCVSVAAGETGCAEDGVQTVDKEVEYNVLESVFHTKKRNRQQIRLYCKNQVYETSSYGQEKGCIKAEPFRQKRGNTEIPYYRIWEKLKSYQERHDEIPQGVIKVGVFGELTGDPKEVNGLLGEKITVEWVQFQNAPFMGEYYFQDESGQLYDLSNMQDIRELVRAYQILLFLDMNCFYRQWQSQKTVEERNEGTHCRWYLDRSREQKNFRDTAAYYKNIFLHVGLWLNSCREINSSSFEFDAKLFQNLTDAADANTDIYLYIRGGSKIASYNLEYSGVCNDEYYDGKSLFVYLISKSKTDDFNEKYRQFLEQGKEDESYLRIRLWKILKSIDNEYCRKILEKYGDTTGKQKLMEALHESYLIFCYKVDAEKKQIEIKYDLSFSEFFAQNTSDMKNYMLQLCESVLKYALENENMYCIRKYFKELLINSTITNAGSIRDLVFAHIWSQPWVRTSFKRINLDEQKKQTKKNPAAGQHKLHKTIYVTIERLENLRMRPVPDMREYFNSVFRKTVCPEVDEMCFERSLENIAKCCETFRYTSSSLYLNSTLIKR